MRIEKKKTTDKFVPENTFTPKQAAMILAGLTDDVIHTPDMMMVRAGVRSLIAHAVKSGRSSRYRSIDIIAIRDCCILTNGIGHNTSYMYLGKNDTLLECILATKPSIKDYGEIKELVGEHINNMGLDLIIERGGFAIVGDGIEEADAVSE